jgi:C4-dicarboxylate-specific signal transduction histidine kinase
VASSLENAHAQPRHGAPEAEAPESHGELLRRITELESRLRQREAQRRAMLHIMGDLHDVNQRLNDQRKAMLHILVDYEQDRRRLAAQTGRLDNSRRALLHILQDSHQSNLRLERSRKAMIHITSDLHETTAEIQRRERELRDKQEQLVQAGKLATLGELTTGVAHELNNPLNNIGLFIGNITDLIELGSADTERILRELRSAHQQVGKATEIISHLRAFGRAAPVAREPISINQVIARSLSLMQEQLRLRQITVALDLGPEGPTVAGSSIQLEQVFINLLTNARDALMEASVRTIEIATRIRSGWVDITVSDTGPGIPEGLEQRIFDPFFTTKGVGKGTGLGLSITYGIIKDHGGSIAVQNIPGRGATFLMQLPLVPDDGPPAPRGPSARSISSRKTGEGGDWAS